MAFGQFEQKPKKTRYILGAIIVPITVNQTKKNWATVFVLPFFLSTASGIFIFVLNWFLKDAN